MDHFFQLTRPKPRGNTVHMRTFSFDPWPADLLAAIEDFDLNEMHGGPRGTVHTEHGPVELDRATGALTI